jgi:hypothetical protein
LLVELLDGYARYPASIKVGVSPESLGDPFIFIVQDGGERTQKLRCQNGSLVFG